MSNKLETLRKDFSEAGLGNDILVEGEEILTKSPDTDIKVFICKGNDGSDFAIPLQNNYTANLRVINAVGMIQECSKTIQELDNKNTLNLRNVEAVDAIAKAEIKRAKDLVNQAKNYDGKRSAIQEIRHETNIASAYFHVEALVVGKVLREKLKDGSYDLFLTRFFTNDKVLDFTESFQKKSVLVGEQEDDTLVQI